MGVNYDSGYKHSALTTIRTIVLCKDLQSQNPQVSPVQYRWQQNVAQKEARKVRLVVHKGGLKLDLSGT